MDSEKNPLSTRVLPSITLIAIVGQNTVMGSITRGDVDRYKVYLIDKGLRNASINSYLRSLQALYNTYIDDGVIETNPFARFKRLPKQPVAAYHLNEEYVARLIRAIADDQGDNRRDPTIYEARKRLVLIYLYTGLRRNEVLEIHRNSVDLTGNRILTTNIKHRERIKRWITIPRSIRDIIKWFLVTFEGDYPFAVCAPRTITRDVKTWMQQAGLPESLHLHSLRHTFITLALRHENIWRIKDHVGHTRIETTQGYTHTDVDDGQELSIGVDYTEHWKIKNGKT